MVEDYLVQRSEAGLTRGCCPDYYERQVWDVLTDTTIKGK